MAVSFTDVATLAPHLSAAPQAQQDLTRQLVTDTIGAGASDECVLYLWAHLNQLIHMQAAAAGGAMSSITSLTIGGISISGGAAVAPTAVQGTLGSTVWGQLYLAANRRKSHCTVV